MPSHTSPCLMLIQTVASENKRLKAEVVLLRETLETRNKQVHILSGRLLHHQTVTEETAKQIEVQQSQIHELETTLYSWKMKLEEDTTKQNEAQNEAHSYTVTGTIILTTAQKVWLGTNTAAGEGQL